MFLPWPVSFIIAPFRFVLRAVRKVQSPVAMAHMAKEGSFIARVVWVQHFPKALGWRAGGWSFIILVVRRAHVGHDSSRTALQQVQQKVAQHITLGSVVEEEGE